MKMLVWVNEGRKNVGLRDLRFTKPAYTQTRSTFWSGKVTKPDWHKWICFWFFWCFWVYAGLVTFPYQDFWFFWVYAGLVHFWHQNVDFFEYMQVLCTAGSQNHVFFSFACRFWRGTSHKTCRRYAILKWTKLKLKTESVFDVLTILSYWRIKSSKQNQ